MSKSFFFICVFFLSSCMLFAQEPPTVTQHPNSGNKCVGGNISLSIVAEGEGDLSYQWFKDGDPLVGEESEVLTIDPVSEDDTGLYFCRVTNINGSTDSNPAQVIISTDVPPQMTINAQHTNMCINTSNTLIVEPGGEPGVNYTWYLDDNIIGYTPNYSISSASESDAGEYYNIAENACGTTSSDTVNILFFSNAEIVSPPSNQTICEGEDVVFTAEAEGDQLYFQWLKNGVMIVGEYSNTLTVSNLTYPNDYDAYQFLAYNICNNDTSNSVYATVNNLPQVVGNPLDNEVCTGETISLNAFAGGTTTPSYQWYDSNGVLENETDTELQITVTEEMNTFHCLISNVCGTVSTDTATVYPLIPVYFTQQPIDTTVCEHDNLSLLVKVNGSEPYTYNWLFNDSDIYSSNVSGQDTDLLSIDGITTGQEGFYSCIVSNMCGSTESDPAYITVNTFPEIILQPSSVELCEEEELEVTLIYEGTEPIEFEWFKYDETDVVSTEPYLFFESADPSLSGEYYSILSNSCGSESTDTITINVLELPQITTQPDAIETCDGESLEIGITATGAEPLTYLWYRNESALTSQTTNVINYENATVANTGHYFCRVSNSCASIDSDTIAVNVGTSPAITWNPVAQSLCENDELNIIMNASGENYYLQWFHNDEPIAGQNDTVLNIAGVSLSHEGYYYCSAFNACDSVNTDTVFVDVSAAPHVNLGDDVHLCEGESITLQAGDEYEHYNWNNGLSNQPEIEVVLSGTYILEVTGENACTNRDTVVVEFHPYHNIIFDSDSITSCGPLMLSAGEGAYSYEWSPVESEDYYITVNETGNYSVTTTGDDFGCETSENIFVEILEPINISLGPDVSAPVNTSIQIGIEAIYDEYVWNTGFTGPLLTVFGEDYGQGSHQFWLTAFAENGCHDTDTIIVTFGEPSSTSIFTNSNNIKIYPNPASETIYLESKHKDSGFIEIYNTTGAMIKKQIFTNNKINEICIRQFVSGTYFIKIFVENGDYSVNKVIIK